jgi:hypothetical protein
MCSEYITIVKKTNGIYRTDGTVNIITNPSTAILLESMAVTKWSIGDTRQQMPGILCVGRNYVASRKVAGSRPDEVNEFSQFTYSFQALEFSQPLTEMSTRSRKKMFLESRAVPVRKADNLTAICEQIV